MKAARAATGIVAMRAAVMLGALGCVALAGCSKCGPGGSAVPFKRGERPAVAATNPPPDRVTPGEVQGRAGDTFPAGTAQVEINGRTLSLKDKSIRAALSLSSQTDATRARALVLTESANGELAFGEVHGDAKTWSAPEVETPLLDVRALGCTLAAAMLRELDANYSVLAADLECGTEPAPTPTPTPTLPQTPAPTLAPPLAPAQTPTQTPTVQPGAPATAMPAAGGPRVSAHSEHHVFVIATDAAAHALEHLALVTRQEASELPLALDVESHDFDADGSADLGLVFSIGAGDAAARVVVRQFNRAGGLAHDASEPEATLLGLADKAKSERRARPELALESAEIALALHAALCKESSRARVYIDNERGLECGASLATGRAASIVIAIDVSQGKLLEALALYKTLSQPAYRLLDNDWERARFALHAHVDDQSFSFSEGPAPELAIGPRVHHPPIAFVDEQRLLLLGASPRVYDLRQRTLEPTGIPAESVVSDPSGRFALSEIVRACDGYHVRVVLRLQINTGVVSGRPLAEPLLAREEPPPFAHCPELPREAAADDGGFRAIEWTAGGLLLTREQQLLLLPLEPPFAPATEARILGASDAVPALSRSFALGQDGRFLAFASPLGIAIEDRQSAQTRLIAAPDGDGAIDAIAIAPSAHSIAIVRGGKLWIGTARVAAPASSPPPAPTTASAPPSPSAPPSH